MLARTRVNQRLGDRLYDDDAVQRLRPLVDGLQIQPCPVVESQSTPAFQDPKTGRAMTHPEPAPLPTLVPCNFIRDGRPRATITIAPRTMFRSRGNPPRENLPSHFPRLVSRGFKRFCDLEMFQFHPPPALLQIEVVAVEPAALLREDRWTMCTDANQNHLNRSALTPG